jgi:hypothetical protein
MAVTCSGTSLINLSAKSKSLHPLRTTDQNGLGICHIEQLHKMLKAKLPGHPDLSRIQLAIAEKKVRDQNLTLDKKNAVRWKYDNGQVGGTYIDAGNSCEAFNKLKLQQICPAAGDGYEKLTKSNPSHQEKIIESLSKYFDNRKNANIFSDMNNKATYYAAVDQAFKACPVTATDFYLLNNNYLNHLRQLKGYQQNLLAFNSPLTYQGFLIQTEINKINAEMARVSKLKASDIFMSGSEYLTGKSFYQRLAKHYPMTEVSSHIGMQTQSEMKNVINLVASRMKDNDECVETSVRNYYNKICTFCNEGLGKSTQDIVNLTNMGVSLLKIGEILAGSMDRDEFFEKAFSCEKSKVRIPSTLTCSTVELSTFSAQSKNLSQYQAMITSKIEDKLKLGTPIGISACTRFFKNPKAVTMVHGTNKYNCGDKTAATFRNGEGSHAITVIGSRCMNGQKQFLVQNSWGSGCSFYSPEYECTGKGGFWAPAHVVVNNIRNINYLE